MSYSNKDRPLNGGNRTGSHHGLMNKRRKHILSKLNIPPNLTYTEIIAYLLKKKEE